MLRQNLKNRNLILIGMPGAGKSTVGVVLAKHLGLRFLDSDLVIQERCNKLLQELIKEQGVEGFLQTENRINASLCPEDTVLATGGSAIYGQEAMAHFKEIGTVLYLRLGLEELEQRLGDLEERGVAMQKGTTLKELYRERAPLYEKWADKIIDCNERQIREIVAEIADWVKDIG